MAIQLSLKEHKRYANYNPDFAFSKPSGSILRVGSTVASLGMGYAFFVCPSAWLNGKYVRWNYGGYLSRAFAYTVIHARVCAGALNRASAVDFPANADVPNSILQDLAAESFSGTLSPVTRDVLVNITTSEPLCTVIFRLLDTWTAESVYMDLDWVEVNEAPGGVGCVFREDFDGAITMESTNGLADYGYISTGQVTGWRRQAIVC